ncbi:hypothetical protein N7526_004396 [Penicillium atrosanguineum]|nr:hypothetical protein N7526_004396 [Penicillium atrosanguineum]
MEQPSSRQRKLIPGDESSEPKFRQQRWSAKTIKSYCIALFPVITCLFVLVVFWSQWSTPDLLKTIIPVNISNIHHEADPSSAGATPRRIELHAEDHAYRDPETQHHDWILSSETVRPDGVLKRVHLINGLFPGPTIEARPGDTLIINVTNNIQEPLSIHWHGLHIDSIYALSFLKLTYYADQMDGVVGVTQCGIPHGTSYIYNITIPAHQYGTFWYHAHSGFARADGLYGGLVVHEPASQSTVRGLLANSAPYSKEFLLLIGDWYHRPAVEVMSWYMRAGSFGNDVRRSLSAWVRRLTDIIQPVPDSLLINGIGHYNCSMAVPARPVDCIDQSSNLTYLYSNVNTVYRLRVVNTGSLVGLTITSPTESLSIIEVDSIKVAERPETNSIGILYPGQRMDLLMRLSSERKTTTLTYAPDAQSPTPDENKKSNLDIQHVPSPAHILSSLPYHANTTEIVYVKTQKFSINHNVPYGYFNHTSWAPQQNPPVPLNGLPREKWDKKQLALAVGDSDPESEPIWVDLVVNNLDDTGHPFHLHGHHFYVLTVYKGAIGWGSYNPFSDSFPPGSDPDAYPDTDGLNLSLAMLRDNVYIPSRAYAILRFRADNPGAWLFHCHVLWHLSSGMAMLVDVGNYTGFPENSCLI